MLEPSILARVIRKYIPAGMEPDVGNQLVPARSARTIESWRYGENPPKGWDLIQLFGILGPSFTNEVLSFAGMGGVHYLNGQVCERKFLAVAVNAASKIADATADGSGIDHTEAPGVLAALDPLIESAPHVAHKLRRRA